MKSIILLFSLCLCGLFSQAQNAETYRVERGEGNFVLVQNGAYVPFDTLSVRENLAQKAEELSAIETEIALLERLVALRRQLAIVREEKRTLNDILEKARKCEIPPSEN